MLTVNLILAVINLLVFKSRNIICDISMIKKSYLKFLENLINLILIFIKFIRF
jgi:hypothetical protein